MQVAGSGETCKCVSVSGRVAWCDPFPISHFPVPSSRFPGPGSRSVAKCNAIDEHLMTRGASLLRRFYSVDHYYWKGPGCQLSGINQMPRRGSIDVTQARQRNKTLAPPELSLLLALPQAVTSSACRQSRPVPSRPDSVIAVPSLPFLRRPGLEAPDTCIRCRCCTLGDDT